MRGEECETEAEREARRAAQFKVLHPDADVYLVCMPYNIQ